MARIQDSGDVTRTQGSMVGTLKYMSPEQVQGQAIDARADLFAAGIVLYQLLTSKRPFDGGSDFDIIQQIVGKPHASPSTINLQLPTAIDAVVARALAKNREQRYATAQEFNAALQAAARDASDPTVVPPAGKRSGSGSTWTSGTYGVGHLDTQPGSTAGLSGSTVTQEVELVYWKDIKDSEDTEDFEGFLARFPTGIYADLARRRLKKLRAIAGDGSSGGSGTILVTRATKPLPPEPAVAVVAPPSDDEPTRALPRRAAPAEHETVNAAALPTASPAAIAPPSVTQPIAPPATPPPATPIAAAPAVPAAEEAGARPRAPLWMLGVLLLAAAGIGYALLSRTDAPSPSNASAADTAGAPAVPASAAIPASVATSPSAPNALSAASAPVSTTAPPPAASSPAKAASRPAQAAANTVKKQDKETALPGKPAVAAPTPAANPPAATGKATTAVSSAAHSEPAKAADTPGTDPAKICEGRWFIAYQLCMTEQCNKPAFKNFKICEERRAMEQRNLEQAKP